MFVLYQISNNNINTLLFSGLIIAFNFFFRLSNISLHNQYTFNG